MTTDGDSIEHIYLAGEVAGHPARDPADGPGDGPASEPTPRVHNLQLAQASPTKGFTGQLAVFNDIYLSVHTQRLRAKSCRYWLHLAFLDPTPRRERRLAWRWLLVALGLGGAGAALLITGLDGAIPLSGSIWLPGALVCIAAAAVCTAATMYWSYDKLVFRTRHGGMPLVEMLNNRPDRRSFAAFLEELKRHIEAARMEYGPDNRELLSAEMREHRRLRDDGVLSAEEYDAVKARILRCHSRAHQQAEADACPA